MSTLGLKGGWGQGKNTHGQTKNVSCSQGDSDGFRYNGGENKKQSAKDI